MKNYLFAPFKDDDDKIGSFNVLKRYLNQGHRNELTMFIGRLESYYDSIISELQADKELVHDKTLGDRNKAYFELKAENDRLKAELKQTNKDYNHDMQVHEEFSDRQDDIIVKLKQDIEKLKADNL